MWLYIFNSIVWIKRKKFEVLWHTIHYFVAALILVLYIPRDDWWPVMSDLKYGLANLNILLLQLALAFAAGLTPTHRFVALLVTMIYQAIRLVSWFKVKMPPLSIWDSYFHAILPVLLFLGIGILGVKERSLKDQSSLVLHRDMEKILGLLP